MINFKKVLTYLLITSFSFTATIRPVASSYSIIPVFVNTSQAEDPAGIPAISENSSGFTNEFEESEDEENNTEESSCGGGSTDTSEAEGEGSNDSTTLSDDQTSELVAYCLEETDKTEEECETEIQ